MGYTYRNFVFVFFLILSIVAKAANSVDEIRVKHLCEQIKNKNEAGSFDVLLSWGNYKKFGDAEKKQTEQFVDIYDTNFEQFIYMCNNNNFNDITRNLKRSKSSCESSCKSKGVDRNFDMSNCVAYCSNKFEKIQSYIEGYVEATQVQNDINSVKGNNCDINIQPKSRSQKSGLSESTPAPATKASPSYSTTPDPIEMLPSTQPPPENIFNDDSEPGS